MRGMVIEMSMMNSRFQEMREGVTDGKRKVSSNWLITRFLNTDALKHYGIKGMQWGVKHGPPYPLSDAVSTAIRKNRFNYDSWETWKIPLSKLSQDKPEKLSELDIKKSKTSALDDAYIVNDHPGIRGGGYAYNCQNCAAAFEMRRRGYDVVSRKMQNGSNVGNIESLFKDGKMINPNSDIINDPFFKQTYLQRKKK